VGLLAQYPTGCCLMAAEAGTANPARLLQKLQVQNSHVVEGVQQFTEVFSLIHQIK